LVVAQLADRLVIVYFLTGRSAASRHRRLRRDSDGITVVAATGPEDDPLRHYRAVHRSIDLTVVGNVDHVETVYEGLRAGLHPSKILESISAEPDPPIWTPRIWLAHQSSQPLYMGLARNRSGHDGVRTLWTITDLQPGQAILLTSYSGAPARVTPSRSAIEGITTAGNPEQLLEDIWDALQPDLRVAAVVIDPSADRYTDIHTTFGP
jgi:IMP cyclohydrolase